MTDKEELIIQSLKEQRRQLENHSNLTALSHLYDATIQARENMWLKANGVICKSQCNIDFKPYLDALVVENIRNNEELKKLECKDCSNEEETIYIRKNKLGQLVKDE